MASSKRGYDPLEASKIVEGDAPVQVDAPTESTEPPKEPELTVPPKSAVSSATSYTLTKDFTMPWGGQMLKLKAGAVIDDATYGPKGAQVFLEAGAPMRDQALGELTTGTCPHCNGTGTVA